MKFTKNKLGVSQIITIVIIIGLVLVAIGIVWAVVTNVIEEQEEDIEMSSSRITVDVQDLSFNETSTSVTVKRSFGEGEIKGLRFYFYDGQDTEEFEVETDLELLDKRTFSFPYTGLIREISLAPVIEKESGEEVVGGVIYQREFSDEEILDNLKEYGGTDSIEDFINDEDIEFDDKIEAISTMEGLVSWWRFEDGPRDEAGNKHGTAVGAVLTPGKFGNAYYFDGVDDYLDFPDFNTDFSNGISICAWVNWSSYSQSWSRILDFSQGQANDNILFTHYTTTTNIVYEVYNNTVSGGKVYANGVIVTNNWDYFCVIQQSSGSVKIYKNGEDKTSSGATKLPQSVNRNVCYIGKSAWSTDGYFKGKIDEVMIFNRALSTEELNFLYGLDLSE